MLAEVAENKELRGAVTILSAAFLLLGIWNIWQTHKDRERRWAQDQKQTQNERG